MTSPDKIDHRIRLTPESSVAAKQAAHDGYVSFNAWVQEAIDQRLAGIAQMGHYFRSEAERRGWSASDDPVYLKMFPS